MASLTDDEIYEIHSSVFGKPTSRRKILGICPFERAIESTPRVDFPRCRTDSSPLQDERSMSAKIVAPTVALSKFVPSKRVRRSVAPLRFDPPRFACLRSACLRSALISSALLRPALLRFDSRRFARFRTTPSRFALLRSALHSFASLSIDPLRSASPRFASLSFAPLKSAPRRFARLSFAPHRFAPLRSGKPRWPSLRHLFQVSTPSLSKETRDSSAIRHCSNIQFANRVQNAHPITF